LFEKVIAVDEKRIKLKWNYSDLSLAQYFYNMERPVKDIWSLVGFDFDIERKKLRQAIYMNEKQDHGKDSRDYVRIKDLLKLKC